MDQPCSASVFSLETSILVTTGSHIKVYERITTNYTAGG